MHIIEIYKSLQGESSFAGLPCVFVRLAGCNLRCAWCDSEYTFSGGRKMSEDEIAAEVEKLSPVLAPHLANSGPNMGHQSGVILSEAKDPYTLREGASDRGPSTPLRSAQDDNLAEGAACSAQDDNRAPLVEITGGEPMLQATELLPLMRRLIASGYRLLLETGGERPLEHVPAEVHKIVDVKCPSSGEAGRFREENLATLTSRDELKFVLASREDYEYARGFIRGRLNRNPAQLILSPAFRKDARERSASSCLLDPQQLAGWMIEDGLNARLGLQIHKFIWEPQRKGV